MIDRTSSPRPAVCLRLSPVLLDGRLAYSVSGPAEDVEALVDALPAELDSCVHRTLRGRVESCHVWGAFDGLTDQEFVAEVLEALKEADVDFSIERLERPPVAIPCGCGQHCAALALQAEAV